MSAQTELESFAVKSYRYLRLSIVVVAVALLAAVLMERRNRSCWEGSISAYYYTPVHAVFVGALVAIGVGLIAIKGSTDWEDMLLNVAGVLAPIVAFVPTSLPSDRCDPTATVGGFTEAYIDNNVLAFAIGGIVALALAYLGARIERTPMTIASIDRPSAVGLILGAALLVTGVIWYAFFRSSFLARAHGGAAIAMFVIIGIVMFINAFIAEPVYKTIYAVTAAVMGIVVIAVLIGKWVNGDWHHQVLWLEVFEIIPFAVYWGAQTVEHWNGGVPTGAGRDARAAKGPVQRVRQRRRAAEQQTKPAT